MAKLGLHIRSQSADIVVLHENNRVMSVSTSDGANCTALSASIYRALSEVSLRADEVHSVHVSTDRIFEALHSDSVQLSRVGVLRLGQPITYIAPIFRGSGTLEDIVYPHICQLAGSFELNGNAVGEPDLYEVVRFVEEAMGRGVTCFSIAGVFSIIDGTNEAKVAQAIRRAVQNEVFITCSGDMGYFGFVDREKQAIINSCLTAELQRFLTHLNDSLSGVGIRAPAFCLQNDGFITSVHRLKEFPVRTVYSSKAAALVGASHLSGCRNCIVVNAHDDHVDIGVVLNGIPQTVTGPFETQKVLPVLYPVCSTIKMTQRIDDELLTRVFHEVERRQPKYERLPIVFVGKEGDRLFDKFKYPWVDVILPDDYRYVEVVGASVTEISELSDRLYSLKSNRVEGIVEEIRSEVRGRIVESGAASDNIHESMLEVIPMAYASNEVIRIRMRVTGTISSMQNKE